MNRKRIVCQEQKLWAQLHNAKTGVAAWQAATLLGLTWQVKANGRILFGSNLTGGRTFCSREKLGRAILEFLRVQEQNMPKLP